MDGNELLGGGPAASAAPGGAASAPANALTGGPPVPSPQQMLAPILASATDPQTGEVNYNKAFIGLASDPKTSPLAAGFLDQAIQRGATNMPQALKELENAYVKQKLIGGAAESLLPKGINVSQEELISALASPEFSRAVPDPRMRAQVLASAPKGGQLLAQWLQVHAGNAASATSAMEGVLHGLHAKLAEEAMVAASPDASALVNAPGWIGKASQKYLAANPQVLQGAGAGRKMAALVAQLGALKNQEKIAQQHYSTLAGPDAPPFSQWWESNLAQQGIV